MNLSQLAESDTRREEAQHRERHHAALIAAIVCRTGKVGLVSVHLCDSGHHASPTSPRLERGVTFGVGQRKERTLCPKPLRALRRSGSTFHVETALRLPPSLKDCVALVVARTKCNEGVPAHKEFLRARQTPVPPICVVCWVLTCTAPGTRYFFYKKLKNVSCEYDRVNGRNSTLQAAWYIRHVRIIWFLWTKRTI